jgi:hypothetical protein
MLESLEPLLHIWKDPGSNLGPKTGYNNRFFVVFLKFFRKMPW